MAIIITWVFNHTRGSLLLAMMVHAAAALPAVPPGLVSLLDLPINGAGVTGRLHAGGAERSREGLSLRVRPGAH